MNNEKKDAILEILNDRFDKNMERHQGLAWADIEKKLEANEPKLEVLNKMEDTGGEPDVIDYDKKSNEYIFCDCSAETPKGRRSLCYDQKALEARKKNKPKDSAVSMAEDMGIELLTEDQYKTLQEKGEYDLKTSSWIKMPDKIRDLGGALFCDRRFDHVFTYHNGADSYYSSRGFRGILRV